MMERGHKVCCASLVSNDMFVTRRKEVEALALKKRAPTCLKKTLGLTKWS